MGVDPKYNQIDFKTELVADGLLLIDVKKNYAYRLLAMEGKIFKKPSVEYSNLTVVKSDTPPFTRDFIKYMVEDIILNPQFRGQNLTQYINTLAIKMREKLEKHIEDYDFQYIATPKKWGLSTKTEPWQIIAMRLYNTLVNNPELKPMSSAMIVPVTIKSPLEFEKKLEPLRDKNPLFVNKLPISKFTKIAFPYNYDKEKIKQVLNYYELSIEVNACWEVLFNKTIQRIIALVKTSNL